MARVFQLFCYKTIVSNKLYFVKNFVIIYLEGGIMSKYYELVASNYDKYKKNYHDEQVVLGVNSIEKIDEITAGVKKYDFINSLDEKYQDKNTFSIRITNDKGYSYYQKVIFDDKDLLEIINSLTKKTISTAEGPRTVKYITSRNNLFRKSFNEVIKLIESDQLDKLNLIFNENSNYSFLIKRYLNRDRTEDNEYLFRDLSENFKDYEVFRKYLVNKDKKLVSNLRVKPTVINTSNKVVVRGSVDIPLKQDGYNERIISFDDGTYKEEEEFLSDEEKEGMYGSEGRSI